MRVAETPGLRESYEAIAEGERFVEVLRGHPEYAAPETVREALRGVLC